MINVDLRAQAQGPIILSIKEPEAQENFFKMILQKTKTTKQNKKQCLGSLKRSE